MSAERSPCICLLPRLEGVGGMVSFQYKLAAGLAARGIQTSSDPTDPACRAILVIGGSRNLAALWKARRRGVRIVQRLDGMNWLHRVSPQKAGIRQYLRAEYGNLLLSLIRARLADHIVYQSDFSRSWWERVYGLATVPCSVIHNGVDLLQYSPQGLHNRPEDRYRLLLVEGSLLGGYEVGLEVAVQLAGILAAGLSSELDRPVELMVAGRVTPGLQRHWEVRSAATLRWAGVLPRDSIPELDRSAHLLYSGDINAACPNSAIEALACGLPVLSFDTGALPELVTGDAGRVVPYGGDPWRLDPPDLPALARAAGELLVDQDRYRPAARARAEAVFSLNRMVERYRSVLL